MERGISGNGRHDRPERRTARKGRGRALAVLTAAAPLLASCGGIQSALDPAGEEASQVATLFWIMAIGGAVGGEKETGGGRESG